MKLSVVVPCFNEEAVLPETVSRLDALLAGLVGEGLVDADSEIVLVDDGSRDATWHLIEAAANRHPVVRGIKLSRNRGHQTALMAGVLGARGDAVVTVDADLQDDLQAIREMVLACRNGADVVYGVRKRRDSDTFFKRFTAESYYRVLQRLGVEVVFNHADYRLLSRRAVSALQQYGECNVFLRGIIPQLGFPSAIVYYDRAERFAGESKYPLRKMLAFAWDGVTSFSAAPLRAITGVGVAVSIGSFMVALWALWVRLFSTAVVPGWASTVVPMFFLGGIQLLCIGIIGEYLAKIHLEVKHRPPFFVEKTAGGRRGAEAGEAWAQGLEPLPVRTRERRVEG
jgi:polyisoprenyl-phosphate glycosyltransferase